MNDDPPTFAQFLAKKKLPYTPWGDLLRVALQKGTVPDVKSWKELRSFANQQSQFVTIQEIRPTWISYLRVIRTASQQQAEHEGV